VPTYDRPEMLWLCLEHLAASPDCQSVEYRVYIDAHHGHPLPNYAEIEEVLDKFKHLAISTVRRPPHGYHGNSFNLLLAYKDAYESSAKHVFMVEDDILVQPGFFAWHRFQHAFVDLDCSVGVAKRPEHAHYASLGVCFKRDVILAALPHCNPQYFRNMTEYCKKNFPPAKWHCEQDGIWCRVLSPDRIAWPVVPVAQHVGWYGYHRKKSLRPQGPLETRYFVIKDVLSSQEAIDRWSKEFHDVTAVSSFAIDCR
jgi:hypothetical protein